MPDEENFKAKAAEQLIKAGKIIKDQEERIQALEQSSEQRERFERDYQKWKWLYGPGGGMIPEKWKPLYIIFFDTLRAIGLFVMVYFIFILGMEQRASMIAEMRDNVCPSVCLGAATFGNGSIIVKPYANVSFGDSFYGKQLIAGLEGLNSSSQTPP